jgi:protein-S-isoprenylcysteine O-methyltransferase Ste14
MSTPFILAYIFFTLFYTIRESRMRIGNSAQNMVGGMHDRNSSKLGALLILVCFVCPALFAYLQIGNILPEYIQWLGLLILVTGICINLWSVKTLGKFYARTLLIQDNHALINTGPYKLIRHPGYLGAILVGLGLAISSGNIFTLLSIILVEIIFYPYRIYHEEKMLITELGEEYKTYMQKSYRLFPYIF